MNDNQRRFRITDREPAASPRRDHWAPLLRTGDSNMTVIILLMVLQDNPNGRLLDGFVLRRNRPAIVRQVDRPFLNRLSRPFGRNR